MEKKKILITGKGSYVGTNFIDWLKQWPDQYEVDEISVRGNEWQNKDFSKYDSVVHVAGIAHVSTKSSMEELYYKTNRDLTIEVAEKAKKDGVNQFIFMSSIIVYGDSSSKKRIIKKGTVPTPTNFYGNSKLQAEEGIKGLENKIFKVAIVRPPMIYGKNSKGNFSKLLKIVRIIPFFPDISNERSMIYINNLTEFLRLLIKNNERGIFFPQNRNYVKTSELVKISSDIQGKKIILTKIFNGFIKVGISKINILNKVFGNLVYDSKISEYKENYQIINFKRSIELSQPESDKSDH